MLTTKLTTARTLGVAFIAALSLGACATRDDIAQINTRLDSIDAQVQTAVRNSQAANDSATRANQRLDTIEGRLQQLESSPGRTPRG